MIIMDTRQLVDDYINDKKFAWSPSTIRSERYRLYGLTSQLNGNPIQLWEYLVENQKPYSRSTSWTRVVEFWQFLIDEGKLPYGKNPYKDWRTKNARVFKNVYTKTTPTISYEEAKNRLEGISDLAIRRRALEMLSAGTRYDESGRCKEGHVVGKGSKLRNVYKLEIEGPDYQGSYSYFRRVLQKVGLKPHSLRKIFLSRLVELGANPFELCEIAGWEDIKTASSYIKVNSNRIKELIERVQS